jgi:glycosylphosphatidylinositol transamidase
VVVSLTLTTLFLSSVVEQLRPWWPELENLFTFMQNQAWGVPTGDHAYMSRYAINAVTLFNKRTNASKDSVGLDVIGRTVEGTMRSLMNLNEPLHQSFYFYLLPSPYNYVSIGIYMISFGLMVAGIAAHTLLLGLLAGTVLAPCLGTFHFGSVILLT